MKTPYEESEIKAFDIVAKTLGVKSATDEPHLVDAIADAIREARTVPPGHILDDKGNVLAGKWDEDIRCGLVFIPQDYHTLDALAAKDSKGGGA